ncbi:hypothetical protein [Komagataeibacter sp. FXV3]|uniref:hypothetical protein n=1 Tax=Komagataeibacter sp. FXV3 TaxID=2608998 RepID=UPI00187B3E81|nr:hypothetical protein [Komagataeibacter sp. FXV3]
MPEQDRLPDHPVSGAIMVNGTFLHDAQDDLWTMNELLKARLSANHPSFIDRPIPAVQ